MKSKIFKLFGVMATVAIMASSLAVPVAAISTPTLSVEDEEISAVTDYTLTFTLGVSQPESTTAIEVTFDDDIDLATLSDVTIETGPGLGSTPLAQGSVNYDVDDQVVTIDTATGGLGQIGAGAIVQLIFEDVTNPPGVGDYGVEVETEEESAVASNTFTTTTPTPDPLPGIARVYNDGGVLMNQFTSLETALDEVDGDDWKITLTAGTYNEPVASAANGLTIEGIGDAEDVIIEPNAGFAFTGDDVTVTGVSFDLSAEFAFVGADAVIEDCLFSGSAASTLLALYGSDATVSGCTVDTTDDPVWGIDIWADGAVIEDCTFEVDDTDSAIYVDADAEVTSNTINGNSGCGIYQVSSDLEATSNTFDGLDMAYYSDGGTVDFNGNTIDNCGNEDDEIGVFVLDEFAAGAMVYNNVISNSNYYVGVIDADADSSLFTFVFNDLTGNTMGFENNAGGTLVAINNFWGGPTGPDDDVNSDDVNADNWLGLAPTSGAVAIGGNDVSDSSLSVELDTGDTADILGVASYAGNPTGAEVSSDYTAKRYLDVLVYGPSDANGDATITIDGVTGAPITSKTVVMIFDAAYNEWDLLAVEARNTYGNYITVSGDVDLFDGTPIVVAEINPTVPDDIADNNDVVYPLGGGVNVPIDVSFSWPTADGADSYQIQIAEELGGSNKFEILDFAANCEVNAFKIETLLKYNTQYWWRVRAVNDVGPGDWTTNFFTTEKEPVATTAPTTTVTTSTIVVEVPTTDPVTPTLTVTYAPPDNEPVIPTYLLWIIVVVGAVLFIAVIVLIVRTRRIS